VSADVLILVASQLVDKPQKILLLSMASKQFRIILRDAHPIWRQALQSLYKS